MHARFEVAHQVLYFFLYKKSIYLSIPHLDMYFFLCFYQPSCLHSCSPGYLSRLAYSTLCWFTAAINNFISGGRGWISISQRWVANDTHKSEKCWWAFFHPNQNTEFMPWWQTGEEDVVQGWRASESHFHVPSRTGTHASALTQCCLSFYLLGKILHSCEPGWLCCNLVLELDGPAQAQILWVLQVSSHEQSCAIKVAEHQPTL